MDLKFVYLASMGTTKHNNYSEKEMETANLLKALAHPARIKIFRHLAEQQSCVCGDIVDEIGLSQSTVSQHLKVMKEAGVITGNIEGTSVCYCIEKNVYEKLGSLFSSFTELKTIQTQCC